MFKPEDYLFWISTNTPSSKNGRRWTGTYFIASKQTAKWRKETQYEWSGQAIWFQYVTSVLDKPLRIEMTFHRKTRRKFDYNNVCQTIQDEMVTHSWIIDDNADEVKPSFGDYVFDPKYPGVVIRVITD
jgi:Holliday junction resolvase RusA-like endonuclease